MIEDQTLQKWLESFTEGASPGYPTKRAQEVGISIEEYVKWRLSDLHGLRPYDEEFEEVVKHITQHITQHITRELKKRPRKMSGNPTIEGAEENSIEIAKAITNQVSADYPVNYLNHPARSSMNKTQTKACLLCIFPEVRKKDGLNTLGMQAIDRALKERGSDD